jgi:hypothetical protein
MGTNKPYAAFIDRRMNARITESETQGHAVISLTNSELELDTHPLTKTPIPKPARAWVRFGPVRFGWTPRQSRGPNEGSHPMNYGIRYGAPCMGVGLDGRAALGRHLVVGPCHAVKRADLSR